MRNWMVAFVAGVVLPGALVAGSVAGNVAWAGPASERVFSRAALEQVAGGQQLVYSHTRTGTSPKALQPLDNHEIRVRLEGDGEERQARVTMGEVGQLRPVSKWSAANGNPLVPIFLESTLRTMARVTGGSEFYIRNRIKEALGSGGTLEDVTVRVEGKDVSAQSATFRPFVGDKNAARMGEFRNLALVFVMSRDLPGDVVRFSATTAPDGAGTDATYVEEIAFTRLEKEN